VSKNQIAMTTVVGIFDDAWSVEKAIDRLAAAGFEDTVLDEAIVAEQPGGIDASRPVRASGSAPDVVLGNDAPNLLPKLDRNTIAQAFKSQLGRFHLPQDVINGYATAFLHNGKFVLVRTDDERAAQAMNILREAGSTRVARHG
jgi:hypothetical protein